MTVVGVGPAVIEKFDAVPEPEIVSPETGSVMKRTSMPVPPVMLLEPWPRVR